MHKDREDRIFAYGVRAVPGRYHCVDCGHGYRHEDRSALPPCPLYGDATHPRAAWAALEVGGGRDGGVPSAAAEGRR